MEKKGVVTFKEGKGTENSLYVVEGQDAPFYFILFTHNIKRTVSSYF